jgi:hypothetical protein
MNVTFDESWNGVSHKLIIARMVSLRGMEQKSCFQVAGPGSFGWICAHLTSDGEYYALLYGVCPFAEHEWVHAIPIRKEPEVLTTHGCKDYIGC